MPIAQRGGPLSGILDAAERKEPFAYLIASFLVLYIFYVASRFILKWVQRKRPGTKQTVCIGSSDILAITGLAFSLWILVSMIPKLLF